MKRTLGVLASAGILAFSFANAGSLTVANSDIEISGGVTAGYFYTSNMGTEINDYFTVSTFAINLEAKTDSFITFTAGIGQTKQPTLLDPNPDANFNFEYGWVSLNPVESLTIDAGKILTNVGYEGYRTYVNENYTFGLVWNAQPVSYPGARVSYDVTEGLSVYAEYNQDNSTGNTSDAYAIGISGKLENINYSISYFDYAADKNIIDFVLGLDLNGIEVGTNIDYQWLDDTAKQAGKDDSAYGIALYTGLDMGVFDIPVRIEYVNDGTSGIYGVNGDDAWTFTVTPTYKPTKNTYVRAEFAYISTDKDAFPDSNGTINKDSRFSTGIEAGFLF